MTCSEKFLSNFYGRMKASAPTGLQKSVILREAKFQINNPYNAPSERELSYHKV